MIASVHGTLEEAGDGYVVVRVGGVGLLVHVPPPAVQALGAVGQQVTLYTTMLVRDEMVTLYGFSTPQGKRLFELLLGVSGVGPRHALSLLSTLAPEDVATAIVGGNAEALMAVPGVGKRTAGRIVVDLQAKLQREWAAVAAGSLDTLGDAVAALQGLGYSAQEAQRAVAALGQEAAALPLEERVRLALQRLGKG